MNVQRTPSGFTLIELMIVVAIIAVLAAIAVPGYQAFIIRAQVSEGMALASAAKVSMVEYKAARSGWPSDNDAAGMSPASDIRGKYVSGVDVGTPPGRITVTFGGQAHPLLAGSTLVFSATSNNGSLDWTCRGKGTVDVRYVPTSCRG